MAKFPLPRMLKRLAARHRGLRLPNSLASAAAISFSLTFITAIVAIALNLVPAVSLRLSPELDASVILLMVPMAALLFALVFEVVRTALSGEQSQPLQQKAPLMAWSPGRGEG